MSKIARESFSVGDSVDWTSVKHAGAGRRRHHRGEVIEVVASGELPLYYGIDHHPRQHESYVVRENEVNYWPHVSKLRKVAK